MLAVIRSVARHRDGLVDGFADASGLEHRVVRRPRWATFVDYRALRAG